MSTLVELVRIGRLQEYELPDWETRYPIRTLLVATDLFDWADQCEPAFDGTIVIGKRTPLEHLEQFFCELRCSERPSVGDIKRLMPTKDGVWKCHPPGSRVFGWFYAPFLFVAITAALEQDLKACRETYGEHHKRVLRFARQNGVEHTIMRGDQLAIFPPKANLR